jgi:nicotinamide-nucleotide amidase
VGVAFAGAAAKVTRLQLTGDRERIRFWASQHALELLRRSLLERT